MAKQGQHNNDAHDNDVSKGPNNPEKSVTMTTGTPKKQESNAEHTRMNDDSGKQAQAGKREWNEDTRDEPTNEGSTRARNSDITSGQSGSDSNASSGTRG